MNDLRLVFIAMLEVLCVCSAYNTPGNKTVWQMKNGERTLLLEKNTLDLYFSPNFKLAFPVV